MGQLRWDQLITTKTLVFIQGAKDWQPAAKFPVLLEVPDPDTVPRIPTVEAEDEPDEVAQEAIVTTSALTAAAPVITQEEDANDEDPIDKGLSKYQILRLIRTELDRLWECQRESMISSIKAEELPAYYVKTRKQSPDIKLNVENLALDYFRKSNVLKTWIHDLT